MSAQRHRVRMVTASVLVLALLAALGGVSGAQASRPQGGDGIQASVGTAFTYQGRLTEDGAPANGPYDFRFTLYNSETGGSQVGSTISWGDVSVDNGLFTVRVDFGNVFDGTALWLEVAVRPGASTDDYTVLDPRQPLTATPYALHSVGGWNLSGNSGTTPGTNFVGTTDGQPLVFKTNSAEALRVDTVGNVGVGTTGPGAKLEASALAGGIGLMGTSASRGVVGRLGIISCPGTYGVGGCAGDTGGAGVLGSSNTGVGIQGRSNVGRAVEGFSTSGIGVIGDSTSRGVIGTLGRTSCAGTYAVGGCAGITGADGVYGRSSTGTAVRASTDSGSMFVGQVSGGVNRARIDANGKGFFNGGTQTGGADFAESIQATQDAGKLEPGDVLEIDPQHGGVRQSRAANSLLVAGVYSTQPSVLAVGQHGIDDSLAGEVPVALLGVVPTKATAENGPIQIGDLLVTSSLPGHAMKVQPKVVNGVTVYPTGAILGKALEPLAQGTGVIKVLVTLR
jgi:hypothetical protein